jgi:hypothetical protein
MVRTCYLCFTTVSPCNNADTFCICGVTCVSMTFYPSFSKTSCFIQHTCMSAVLGSQTVRVHDDIVNLFLCDSFLGAFANLRKASLCLSIPLSVRMELGSHWTDFHEIPHFGIFRNNVKKNSSFIKIRQENRVLYIKTCVRLSLNSS